MESVLPPTLSTLDEIIFKIFSKNEFLRNLFLKKPQISKKQAKYLHFQSLFSILSQNLLLIVHHHLNLFSNWCTLAEDYQGCKSWDIRREYQIVPHPKGKHFPIDESLPCSCGMISSCIICPQCCRLVEFCHLDDSQDNRSVFLREYIHNALLSLIPSSEDESASIDEKSDLDNSQNIEDDLSAISFTLDAFFKNFSIPFAYLIPIASLLLCWRKSIGSHPDTLVVIPSISTMMETATSNHISNPLPKKMNSPLSIEEILLKVPEKYKDSVRKKLLKKQQEQNDLADDTLVDQTKKSTVCLSVAGRALSKHFQRTVQLSPQEVDKLREYQNRVSVIPSNSSQTVSNSCPSSSQTKNLQFTQQKLSFWSKCIPGNPTRLIGSPEKINSYAVSCIETILQSPYWKNIHFLNPSTYFLEIRHSEGYGVRWQCTTLSTGEKQWVFRGFVEPPMEDGHSVGWKH